MSELIGRPKGQGDDPAASGADAQPSAAQPAAEPADLAALAEVSADDAVVRRTKDGWRVGDADVPDLTSAMVLADLISAELAAPEPAAQPAAVSGNTEALGGTSASGAAGTTSAASDAAVSSGSDPQTQGRTAAPAPDDASAGQKGKGKAKGKSGRSKDPAPSEASKLRNTIGQLEHALTARIRVEQAIGVLAERHRIQPRQAFEQLRTAARNRGRRVIDIASDVVASATNPLLQLPDELSRPRSGVRQPRRNRQTPTILGSE